MVSVSLLRTLAVLSYLQNKNKITNYWRQIQTKVEIQYTARFEKHEEYELDNKFINNNKQLEKLLNMIIHKLQN